MKKIALIPNIRESDDIAYAAQTVEVLQSGGASVFAEAVYAGLFDGTSAILSDAGTVYADCDLIVVLGGDGSILRAAEYAMRYDVPLLGINLGRLGYMADLEKDEIPRLLGLFDGQYTVTERMTLSVRILTENGEIPLPNALNDVVIDRGGYARSIDLVLYADGRTVRTVRADGLILATPTGSTAYSMAAGGSVLDPTLSCICATPICPISQYARPLIFSGGSTLSVEHTDDRAPAWNVTVDGTPSRALHTGERLSVARSEKCVRMLSLKDEGFFETLNGKISKYELKN